MGVLNTSFLKVTPQLGS